MKILEEIKLLIAKGEKEKICNIVNPEIIDSFQYENIESEIRILYAIIESYLLNFRQSSAYPYSTRTLALCEKIHNNKLKAECLIQNAALLIGADLHEEAMKNIHKALAIGDKLQDKLIEADGYNCLALLHQSIGLIDNALEMAEHSLLLVRSFGTEDELAKVLQTYSVYLQSSNRLDETFSYLLEALAICEKRKDIIGVINCLSSLAFSCGCKKDYNKALEYFLQCMALEKSLKSPNEIRMAGILKGVSISYAAVSEKELGLTYAKELLALAENTTEEIIKQYAFIANSSVLNDLEEYKEAFEFYRRFHTSFLSERTEKAQRQVQLLHIIYETERKQNEAEIATVKAKQLENEIKLRKNEIRLKQNQVRTKQNELTAAALHLAQKNTMLMKLENIVNTDFETVEDAAKIMQKIREEIRSGMVNDQAWAAFEEQFKRTHGGLTERLMNKFPSLSPMELKICSMIALDLSSKDMAAILCVEVNSVEVYRYRIRKKLNVKGKESLKKYIITT